PWSRTTPARSGSSRSRSSIIRASVGHSRGPIALLLTARKGTILTSTNSASGRSSAITSPTSILRPVSRYSMKSSECVAMVEMVPPHPITATRGLRPCVIPSPQSLSRSLFGCSPAVTLSRIVQPRRLRPCKMFGHPSRGRHPDLLPVLHDMGQRATQGAKPEGNADDEGMQHQREDQGIFARLQQHLVKLVDDHPFERHC